MNRLVIFRATSITLLVAWAILIFTFSSQTANESSKVSAGVVENIVSVIYPQYDELPADTKENVTRDITVLVRKGAHFSEYFLLGALAVLSAITFDKLKLCLRLTLAYGFCVMYAVSDEIHQIFVPGRACRLVDILIDSAGAALAVIISVIILRKYKFKSGERYEKKGFNRTKS